MMMNRLDPRTVALALGIGAVVLVACTREPVMAEGTTTMDTSTTGPTMTVSTTTGPTTTGVDTNSDDPMTSSVIIDEGWSTDTDPMPSCVVTGDCERIDILFVVDNSAAMGEEQLRLARSFEYLTDELQGLQSADGQALTPDVNIMVTTTDMGHPLCTPFQRPDYAPHAGAPVYQGCNARINRFTGLDPMDPVVFEEACTDNCPVDIVPGDHFVHFDATESNVPNDDAAAALACIGPQGIDGCGYEAPLESMLQALNENACWNAPEQGACDGQPEWADVTEGFMRDDATLAIVFLTNELDCSVQTPQGYSFFTDLANNAYWNINPDTGTPQSTSAICFNAGVTCTDANGDGLYEGGCAAQNSEVLHPVSRYTQYIDYLSEAHGKEIVMLSMVGVPPVVSHSADLPYEPTEGGLIGLLYRNWIDGPYPNGDIIPDEWTEGQTAAHKIFLTGDLGPGCNEANAMGEFTGQALPPVRIRDVCQNLDSIDEDSGDAIVRCCIESVCGDDFEPAMRCLSGMLSSALSR